MKIPKIFELPPPSNMLIDGSGGSSMNSIHVELGISTFQVEQLPEKRLTPHEKNDDSFKMEYCTLPETNIDIAPENRPGPNRKVVFQPSIFRGFPNLILFGIQLR